MSFRRDLERLINSHSQENGSNTPDFVLATFLSNCLIAFDAAVNQREEWNGRPKGSRSGMEPADVDFAVSGRKAPTIAELEAILNSEDERPVMINSDGSVSPMTITKA